MCFNAIFTPNDCIKVIFHYDCCHAEQIHDFVHKKHVITYGKTCRRKTFHEISKCEKGICHRGFSYSITTKKWIKILSSFLRLVGQSETVDFQRNSEIKFTLQQCIFIQCTVTCSRHDFCCIICICICICVCQQ